MQVLKHDCSLVSSLKQPTRPQTLDLHGFFIPLAHLKSMADQKHCFVVSPIGTEGSDTRLRADKVLKHIIRPSVANCGYVAQRADEISDPGIITTQVIDRILTDQLVIADLSERNPNVYYELALRHATGLPLIQLIDSNETIPFDVAQMRTIPFDYRDLDSVESAKEAIANQINSLEKTNGRGSNPLSISIDLKGLATGSQPGQNVFGELTEKITIISRELREQTDRLAAITDTSLNNLIDGDGQQLDIVLRRLIEGLVPAIRSGSGGPVPVGAISNARGKRKKKIDYAINQLFDALEKPLSDF